MKIEKYAAIDIGSNAIRLLISNVIQMKGYPTKIAKNALTRVPIRLGADSFTKGKIAEENINSLVNAIRAFQLIMKIHKVKAYRVCATSAIRDAQNKKYLTEKVKKETNVNLEIIDGKEEAAIIAKTDIYEKIQAINKKNFLYVDVGGGSTELSIIVEKERRHSKSFQFGTVRYLSQDKKNREKIWKEIKKWIYEKTKGLKGIILIGSGGNITKLFKLVNVKQGKPLRYRKLKKQFFVLQKLSYSERIAYLELNPDRADVIIPAAEIYLNLLKWTKTKRIYVPKIGLSDGIIKSLFENDNKKINRV